MDDVIIARTHLLLMFTAYAGYCGLHRRAVDLAMISMAFTSADRENRFFSVKVGLKNFRQLFSNSGSVNASCSSKVRSGP